MIFYENLFLQHLTPYTLPIAVLALVLLKV